MLTNNHLLFEKPHQLGQGLQRIYRFPSGMGLSVVNSTMLHSYSYAWEIAVIRNVKEDGTFSGLDYSTPMTNDVEVFMSDDEANDFIELASNTI